VTGALDGAQKICKVCFFLGLQPCCLRTELRVFWKFWGEGRVVAVRRGVVFGDGKGLGEVCDSGQGS
jgi:hypothetical protein